MPLIIVLVFGCGIWSLADHVIHKDEIYPRVKVGTVDVGGMTLTEASDAIRDAYSGKLKSTKVTVYSTDYTGGDKAEEKAIAERIELEGATSDVASWTYTAKKLGAKIPATELAQKAYDVGRDDGGFVKRLKTMLLGEKIPIRASYKKDLDGFIEKIDSAFGTPRADYGVKIDNGYATVTEGNDGFMVDKEEFENSLNHAFLESEGQEAHFCIFAEFAPLRINEEQARAVADKINNAIADGVVFTYSNASWKITRSAAGKLIKTDIEQNGSKWELIPSLKKTKAKKELLREVKQQTGSVNATVTFAVNDKDISVTTSNPVSVPAISDAVDELEIALFGEKGGDAQPGAAAEDGEWVSVIIDSFQAPETMDFDKALEYGVIEEFQSWTTEYATGSGLEEQTHNIHLVADLLNNSIAKANGGEWSFNDIAGECNADAGFQAASGIVNGRYVSTEGGGICCAAGTVFNCVFEAGLPVPLRYNHTLRSANYPDGRDAAINWPDLNLVWKNDTTSDILLKMTYTEDTITASLYGIDPGYSIKSTDSGWKQGEKPKKYYVIDENLADGEVVFTSDGVRGSSISVTRYVYDSNGDLRHSETFYSDYTPRPIIYSIGPGKKANSLAAQGKVLTDES